MKIYWTILAVFLPAFFTGISVPALAGRIEPIRVPCWLFRGDKLELNQTCTYESVTWAGGGTSFLRWEDGVRTKMTWGLQGRGEKPCADGSIGVDGVCGTNYYRHPATLKRISSEERESRLKNNQPSVNCVLLRNKSICWLR
ncbi:MAG: hypothetical protein MUE44_35585 [Oscillatoriaceae cyanobacterium Prado104]|jgi:hypothetical protein|nr:hypothetical protein [Oscillatoriaceae cyanobacterium Prado104]